MDSTYLSVVIAFVIFIGLAWHFGRKPIAQAFDDYASKVSKDIDEAATLCEDARNLLADTKTKHANALKEAETILSSARQQAQLIRENAERDLDALLKRREQQALDRIRILEEQAMGEIRAKTVDMALSAAEHILRTQMTAQQDETLIGQQTQAMGENLKKVA